MRRQLSLWIVVVWLLLAQTVWASEYVLGITPWQKGKTDDDITHLYKPMLGWLGQNAKSKFSILQTKNYRQMIGYIAGGRVHFANLSPVPYVKAKKINPQISLLVTELKWNKDRTEKIDSYLGYIVALKSRLDINEVNDLKNKVFGFVKSQSSSGFKYPKAILLEQGISNLMEFFSKFMFLGSHPGVTDAIVEGKVDAGATWDFNLSQAIKKHGDVFKIILTTPPIPNLCIAAHPSLPTDMQLKIQELLLDIDENLLQGMPADGYVKRPDSFYDIVRKID